MRTYYETDHELTHAEIAAQFGDLIAEAISSIDVDTLAKMAEDGNRRERGDHVHKKTSRPRTYRIVTRKG